MVTTVKKLYSLDSTPLIEESEEGRATNATNNPPVAVYSPTHFSLYHVVYSLLRTNMKRSLGLVLYCSFTYLNFRRPTVQTVFELTVCWWGLYSSSYGDV